LGGAGQKETSGKNGKDRRTSSPTRGGKKEHQRKRVGVGGGGPSRGSFTLQN